jgi:arsenate reductase-like glutaredoxin family protein
MTCKKAQGYLEKKAVEVSDQTDASKHRKGRGEALKLARSADKIVVAKGKRIVSFDMKKAPPDDDTLAASVLGPSGNLRAPTVRIGKTLLIGFNEEAYQDVLGE